MNIGTLVGYLNLDDRQFKSTLNKIPGDIAETGEDAGRKMGGGLQSGIMKFAAPIAAAFSAVAIGGFIKNTITEASNLAESANAISVTFGAAAGEVSKLGANAATTLGLSNVQFNELAVRFSAFAKSVAGPGGNVAATLDQMTRRASDFASVMNIEVSQAAELFQSGLAGETEPLRKFGIDLSAAAVQAYAYANGIATAGSELTEAEKVQARYGLLMQQTSQTQGDFANTADGLANGMRVLKASFSDVQANIGTAFLPFMALGVQAINGLMGPLKEATAGMAEWGTAMGEVFTNAGGGMDGLQAMLGNIGQTIADFFTGGGFIQALQNMSLMREQILMSILNALPGIIDGIVAFIPQFVEFITGTLIPSMVTQFAMLVTALATFLSTALPAIFQGLVDVLPGLVTSIGEMLPTIIETLLGLVPMLLEAGLTFFSSLIDALITVVPQIITAIVDMIPKLADSVVSMLPQIVTAAIELFTGLIEGLIEVIPVLLDAIIGMIPDLVGSILEMLPDIILAAIELFLGLITGLLKALPDILVAIIDMIPKLVTTIINMIPKIIDAGIELFLGLMEAIPKALPDIIRALIDMVPKLVTALINTIPQLIDAGFQLLQGLVRGIMDNAPRIIGGIAKSLGDMLVGGVKAIFGIKSPSTVFFGIGGMLMAGMVKGIADGRGEVMKEVDKLNDVIDLAAYNGNLNASMAVSAIPDGIRGRIEGMNTVTNSKNFTYIAAPGSSFTAEEELYNALNRPRAMAF